MDDIQKTTENAYDAIRKAEEPTCSVCHAPIGLIYHSEQASTPCVLYVRYEFGCRQCGRLGNGATPYDSIKDYVMNYDAGEPL